MGYRGQCGTGGRGHMCNEGTRGNGLQGVWATRAMGYKGHMGTSVTTLILHGSSQKFY